MVGENGNVWPFMYFSLIHHLLPLNFWMAEKEFLGDRREGLRCGQNVMLGINQAFFQRFSAATRARIRRKIESSPKFIEADKSIFEIL